MQFADASDVEQPGATDIGWACMQTKYCVVFVFGLKGILKYQPCDYANDIARVYARQSIRIKYGMKLLYCFYALLVHIRL